MRQFSKLVLAIFCLVFVSTLLACASKNFKEPEVVSSGNYPTSRTYAGNMDKVWEATREAMEERNMPISQSSREKGLVITDWTTGKSDRLFSGYGESKIPYTIRFKFLVQLTPAASRTTVNIKAKEEYMTDVVTSGNHFNGSVYQWVATSSSGFKESTLLDDIAEKLKGE